MFTLLNLHPGDRSESSLPGSQRWSNFHHSRLWLLQLRHNWIMLTVIPSTTQTSGSPRPSQLLDGVSKLFLTTISQCPALLHSWFVKQSLRHRLLLNSSPSTLNSFQHSYSTLKSQCDKRQDSAKGPSESLIFALDISGRSQVGLTSWCWKQFDSQSLVRRYISSLFEVFTFDCHWHSHFSVDCFALSTHLVFYQVGCKE
jgi:hypothetical protein